MKYKITAVNTIIMPHRVRLQTFQILCEDTMWVPGGKTPAIGTPALARVGTPKSAAVPAHMALSTLLSHRLLLKYVSYLP